MTAPRTIVIAGSTGFLGSHLTAHFRERGDTVIELNRSGTLRWGQTAAITDALEGADVLINLAGKSINCRYTPENRAALLSSRLDTTRELAAAVRDCEHPPPLWINASTAAIYRQREDRAATEDDTEYGAGFSEGVARAWEQMFFEAELPGVRRVALRLAIVLGDGGALVPFLALGRLGLGGPQFDGRWFAGRDRREAGVFHEFSSRWGRQKVSWVHLADVHGIVEHLIGHPELEGAVNATAPEAADNRTLMRSIRKALRMPLGLPAFRWMTELGALALHTEAGLVLGSMWAAPKRLLESGYRFEFTELEEAVRDVVARRRQRTTKGRQRAESPRAL